MKYTRIYSLLFFISFSQRNWKLSIKSNEKLLTIDNDWFFLSFIEQNISTQICTWLLGGKHLIFCLEFSGSLEFCICFWRMLLPLKIDKKDGHVESINLFYVYFKSIVIVASILVTWLHWWNVWYTNISLPFEVISNVTLTEHPK